MNRERILSRDEAWSRQLAQRVNGRLARVLVWLLARTGDSVFWLAVIGWLLWRRNTLGWLLLAVVAVTAVVVAVLKGIFRRQRPRPKWAIATDKYSFPSGHAARATAVAVTLAAFRPAWGAVWLFWAVLVALARVALSRHYLSDVGSGILVGLCIGAGLQAIW